MIKFVFRNTENHKFEKLYSRIRIVFTRIENLTKWQVDLHVKSSIIQSGDYVNSNTLEKEPETEYNIIYVYSLRKSYKFFIPIFSKYEVKQAV